MRMVSVSDTPVSLAAAMESPTGAYTIQNVNPRARVFYAEGCVPGAAPAAGDPAQFLSPSSLRKFTVYEGFTFWFWTHSGVIGELAVTNSAMVNL